MTRTLADEIADELPALLRDDPAGAMVKAIAARLAADAGSVRAAMETLDAAGRAWIVRRRGARAFVLVAADDPVLACRVCHAEFERPAKSRRVTCSKSCGVALSWRNPEARKARSDGIRAQRATDEGRANSAERNARRWARPGERERLSERNRERWADPVAAAETAAALRATNGLPENRERARAFRQAAWDDPEARDAHVEAIRRSKGDPDSRRRFSEALRLRWKDPVWRAKYLAASRLNAAKATAASVEARKARTAGSEGSHDRPGSTGQADGRAGSPVVASLRTAISE